VRIDGGFIFQHLHKSAVDSYLRSIFTALSFVQDRRWGAEPPVLSTSIKMHIKSKKLKSFFIHEILHRLRLRLQTQQTTNTTMPSSQGRVALFQKSTRKNQEFERFLCDGQESTLLDATRSKYIPLSYFVTPATATETATETPTVTPTVTRRSSTRHAHGIADKMPFESFKLINLQQRGSHAHSLVLFKSRAITTNPEQIAIFECNGQYTQSEIRVIHTDPNDETGTAYDVTENYFSPISPKVCLNYGNDTYNPGYCGIFGMIAMVFFRGGMRPPTTPAALYGPVGGSETPSGEIGYGRPGGEETTTTTTTETSEIWIRKWTLLLKYMRQDIPDEPQSHGCLGTDLAARVQEIIAAYPSTATGHQQAEEEILREIKKGTRPLQPPPRSE